MYQSESNWVTGLRLIAWTNFITGIIGAFIMAWQFAQMFGDPGGWGQEPQPSWGIFFITLIGMFIATFIITAIIMVFLDMARDISVTRQVNYNMLKTLQQSGDEIGSKPSLSSIVAKSSSTAGETWICSQCNEKNSSTSRACKGCGKYK